MTGRIINEFTKYIIGFAVIFILSSCDILRDSPFEISKWSPGSGYHARPETLSVSVLFSHDPDRESVEKNFSFTSDGDSVRGVFQWEGKKMEFLPYIPLEIDKNYSIRIAPNAHTQKGLSMDREFEGRFTTRAGTERPRIVSFSPETEGVMENSGTLVIGFSLSVSLNSLRANASFSPSVSGAWSLEEAGTRAVFTPLEPWPQGKRFEFRLPASLEGGNGMTTGRDFLTVFYVGTDHVPPYLVSAWRLTADGEREELIPEPLGEFVENSGWEKDDRLLLTFSRQVDLLSARTALATENASSLVLEMPDVYPQTGFAPDAVFRFDKPPSYESRFSLRLRKGVKDMPGNESVDEHLFRIFANGENSKPPSLVGIRMPMSPNPVTSDPPDSTNLQLRAYSTDRPFDDLPIESAHYPYISKTPTWIECYFDCASGAVIDPFSVMENFRIETSNNVILFSPLVVRNSGFTVADPHPAWTGYQRVEIAGDLTNTINAGLVHFFFNKGITDSAGNSSENQFRISLLK